jgi:hypothetical protein
VLQPWEDIQEDTTLIDRLQSWLMTQPGLCAKVTDAAHHFGVEPVRIEQAAAAAYWLGLEKLDGVEHVFADGE